MRRLHALILPMWLLTPLRSRFSQSLNDFVKRIEGDTLVVKDYVDMNGKPNSLYEVLALDSSDPPAGCVHDMLSREVATMVNKGKGPETYTVTWDASSMASGVYFCTLRAGSFVQTRKMTVMK